MKLLISGLLLLAAAAANAQAVRYSAQGHLPIETQPAPGHERAEYLGMGDSVRVLSKPATAIPASISAAMRQQFVYVSYPAYRGQPAGQGWVLRRGLVCTADSLLLDLPPLTGQTVTTTRTVTTKRYVTKSGPTPRPAGKAAPKPTPHR